MEKIIVCARIIIKLKIAAAPSVDCYLEHAYIVG
jgi:hypothetical protein